MYSQNLQYSVIPNSVARTIVIDGANVMHCGSGYPDRRENSKSCMHKIYFSPGLTKDFSAHIPDVMPLLSLIRFFVVRDFEVFVVISRKYAKQDATNFKSAIDRLIENHLCVVVPSSNLDDSVALQFASQINGVVITTDQYRDHASDSLRFNTIVRENRLGIKWENVKCKNTRAPNIENDYVPSKRVVFVNERESSSRMSENGEILVRIIFFKENIIQMSKCGSMQFQIIFNMK